MLGGGSMANGLGMALQTPEPTDDKTLDAFFDLTRAQNVAARLGRQPGNPRHRPEHGVRRRHEHIGWQVTGRYPEPP